MAKKYLWALLVITIALGAVYLHFDKDQTPADKFTKPVMKIGIIGPMSGNNSALGKNCRQGIEYALKGLKTSLIDYKLIVEDDGFQAARAASAAHKLINVDKVDAIITCSAVSGSAAAPIAAANQRFILTVIASEAKIANQSKYSFLHWPTPAKEAAKLLDILAENQTHKVIFMVENHPGAKALANAAIEAARNAGLEVSEYNFMSTERNFTDIVLKADAEKADMWVLLTLQPGINLIGKRMQEQGIKTPYTTEEIPTFMEDKSMFEGLKFVDVYDGQPELMRRYAEQYKTDNLYGVAFAYDAMVIIDKLSDTFYKQNQRLPDSDELAKALLTMQGHIGAVGPVTISEDGILESEAVIKKVEKGKIIPFIE